MSPTNSFLRIAFLSLIVSLVSAMEHKAAGQQSDAFPFAAPQVTDDDRLATKSALDALQRFHISHRQLNDRMYQRAVQLMLQSIDPYRLYFIQADVDRFYDDAEAKASALRSGDPTVAFQLFEVWMNRVSERLPLLVDLTQTFDDRAGQPVRFNTNGVRFASNKEEIYARWRDWVDYQIWLFTEVGVPINDARRVIMERHRRLLPGADSEYTADIRALLLSSVARTYDPHSGYISERELCYYNQTLRWNPRGIGIAMDVDEGYLEVTKVFQGGPAANDGRLGPGDRIFGIASPEGRTAYFPFAWHETGELFNSLLLGREGTKVRLFVLPRDGSPPYQRELARGDIDRYARGTIGVGAR